MPSVEELLSVAEVDANTRSAMDSRIEIDADTRIIRMMPQDELFGVESDEKSERKYFKVHKIVGNGVDLSKLQLRINYQNASKIPSGKDMYIVTDATVYNDEWVYFSWELSRKVTQYKGNIYFIVCAVKADSKGNITNEWNTTLAEGKVLEGLEVETNQEQQYQASDYLEQLKQQLLDYSKEIKDTFPSDYTETVENVKNLQNDVQKLDNNKITKFYTNNNGDTVLNDSDDGKIQDLVIYGKSEQKQYKGTNLLDAVTKNEQTDSGVTVTPQVDGSFLLNGTTTKDNADIYLAGTWGQTIVGTLDPTKKYFFRGSGNSNIIIKVGTQEDIKVVCETGSVINGFSYAFYYLQFPKSGTTFNNVVFYPQINEGEILLDYEPYTGGKPSPSPEYPQEIKAVVNPVIKTHGTNLLDIKDVAEKVCNENGLTYSVQQGVIKVKGTAISSDIMGINFMSGVKKKITANSTYIFNPNPTKNIEDTQCYLDFTNNKNLGFSITNYNINKPINIQESQSQYLFSLNVRFEKGAQIDMEWKPQLIISNTLLPYKPYQSSQATLTYELYAIPVSSGGNVTIDGQQYIADYVDIERGKLVRMCKEIDFTKIAPTSYADSKILSKEARYKYATNNLKKIPLSATIKTGSGFITAIRLIHSTTWDYDVIGVAAHGQGGSEAELSVRIPVDVDAIKYFESIGGCKGVFQIDKPEEINLTQEEIEAFKALSTYYPKTYIDAESEQLEAYTMFNYPVSMEKGWEYVKQQIGDTRKYVYDMDTKLTETEASTLEAKIDTAILSEMIGG